MAAIIQPSRMLIRDVGFCLQYRTVWIAPILGMGIACFGLQVITTTCYTYAIDCYRAEGSEVSRTYAPRACHIPKYALADHDAVIEVFNFMRQELGMTFAFYVIRLADKIGYQFTFLLFACLGSILGFIPMVVLMWRGKEIRERMGKPRNVNQFDTDE